MGRDTVIWTTVPTTALASDSRSVSGSSSAPEDVVGPYELCGNAYLTTPVDPMAFLEAVQELEHFWLSAVGVPEPND